MRFWKRDVTGKRRETGVLYFGESKRHGDAWVAHGYGGIFLCDKAELPGHGWGRKTGLLGRAFET